MWEVVKMWAEPPVQDLSFGLRAVAHTGVWALWLLFMQYAMMLVVSFFQRIHLKQYTSPPKFSWHRMLAETSFSYLGWTWTLGLVAAWINPGAKGGWSWDYSCPNLLGLCYYATACLMMYDAYSFPIHKWMHENKTAFRLMHKKHHEMKAALDVTTSGYMAITEGVASSALPMAALYILGVSTGNWWYTMAGLWHSFNIVILGHSGVEITMNCWQDLFLLPLNPMAALYFTCPVRATPNDHADHHMNPRKNYAFFYTYWDDLNNSATHKHPPCSLLVLAAHGLWQLLLFSTLYSLLTRPLVTLAVYVACYLLVPPAAAAAVSEALRLPQITRAIFGRVMDAYRADNYITFAEQGMPGAFSTALTAAPAPPASAADDDSDVARDTAAAADRGKDQDIKEPVYLFACHPAGVVSRSAFCTFAARGWRSPVSHLQDVRLAVGNQLFYAPVPLVREFLLACGCIPAERDRLQAALRSGCSIAVTPGGWREARNHGSYQLILKQRSGFVQLAQQTGALLVPVLCLGEQDLATMPLRNSLLWVYRFVQVFRPHPVKVVYGQPVAHQVGEGIEKLHSRYMHALLELGKQHGVQLQLVQ